MIGLFALYKCLKCEHEFADYPGPTQCQKCGHVYLKWVSYQPYPLRLTKEEIDEIAQECIKYRITDHVRLEVQKVLEKNK